MNNDDEPNLHETVDALVWAETFVKYKKDCGWDLDDIDEELMLGWFANCMYATEMDLKKKHELEEQRWYYTWLHLDRAGVTIRDIDKS
jgi:hypothetical protein